MNLNEHYEERKETMKAEIVEIVQSIDDIWVLSLILRSVKCMIKK